MPVKSLLLLFRDYADRSEKRKIDKEQRIEFNILRRKEYQASHVHINSPWVCSAN